MPRADWKGSISFGLVSIPVILHNSEDNSERVTFHQIDKKNKARVRYKRVNGETGKEVDWKNIIKGYEYDEDTIIPVEGDELKKMVGENARTIAVEIFINQDDIHFVDVYRTYYLTPDKNGEKGYVILREALKKSKKVGISKVIIGTKEYVSAIAYYNNALVLYLLRYIEEIKPMMEFNFPLNDLKKYKVTNKEIDIANQLIHSMSSKWYPEKYKDEYKEAVHQWAKNKIKHTGIKKMQQRMRETSRDKIVSFVDLLRKSLNETKKTKKQVKISKPHTKKKSHPIRHRQERLH